VNHSPSPAADVVRPFSQSEFQRWLFLDRELCCDRVAPLFHPGMANALIGDDPWLFAVAPPDPSIVVYVNKRDLRTGTVVVGALWESTVSDQLRFSAVASVAGRSLTCLPISRVFWSTWTCPSTGLVEGDHEVVATIPAYCLVNGEYLDSSTYVWRSAGQPCT
jgi:hypothetical protein